MFNQYPINTYQVGQVRPELPPAFIGPVLLGGLTALAAPNMLNFFGDVLLRSPHGSNPNAQTAILAMLASVTGGLWLESSRYASNEVANFGTGLLWGGVGRAALEILIGLITNV